MKKLEMLSADPVKGTGVRVRRKNSVAPEIPVEQQEVALPASAPVYKPLSTVAPQTATPAKTFSIEQEPGKVQRWSEAFQKLGIATVDIPWNTDSAHALEMLRRRFGNIYSALDSPMLDETCFRCKHLSNDEQLNILGEVLQNDGLRFGFIAINPEFYRAFIVEEVETRAFQRLWYGILSRPEFFSYVHLFSRSRENKSFLDIRIPIEQIQLRSRVTDKIDAYPRGERIQVVDNFLLIPKPVAGEFSPYLSLDVYDLSNSKPKYIPNVETGFDPNFIQPFFCRFTSPSGQKYEFRGSDFSHLRSPENMKEMSDEEPTIKWHGISLDNTLPDTIPEVLNAEPFITYQNHIIYRYKRIEDLENRERHVEATLLDYNLATDEWRMAIMPNFSRCHLDSLVSFYSHWSQKNWVLIPNGTMNFSSYSFRVWNPLTNQCYRMPDYMIGKHQIEQFIPIHDELYMFLDDGRLIRYYNEDRPDTDLIFHLFENKNCDLNLSPWVREKARRFDSFNESDRLRMLRSQKLLPQGTMTDRYVIRFATGEEIEICISVNNI